MSIRTDEELMSQVATFAKKHQDAYDFISDYYGKYRTPPVLKDITEGKGSQELLDIYLTVHQLAEAGCIAQTYGYGLVPLVSPEEAVHWCVFSIEDQDECEKILTFRTIDHMFHHKGEKPTATDLLLPYKDSALYQLIKVRAEMLLRERFHLTCENDPQVELSDTHKTAVSDAALRIQKERIPQAV